MDHADTRTWCGGCDGKPLQIKAQSCLKMLIYSEDEYRGNEKKMMGEGPVKSFFEVKICKHV